MLFQDGTGQNPFPEPISADELFRGLTPRQQEDLALIKIHQHFLPKTTVFASREMPLRIYLHRSGRAILFHDESLINAIYACPIESDRIYGIVEVLTEKPFETGIETLSTCEFDVIDRGDFLRFIRNRPLLCYRLLEIIGRMYYLALQEVKSL